MAANCCVHFAFSHQSQVKVETQAKPLLLMYLLVFCTYDIFTYCLICFFEKVDETQILSCLGKLFPKSLVKIVTGTEKCCGEGAVLQPYGLRGNNSTAQRLATIY
jgi:hypothetical protein